MWDEEGRVFFSGVRRRATSLAACEYFPTSVNLFLEMYAHCTIYGHVQLRNCKFLKKQYIYPLSPGSLSTLSVVRRRSRSLSHSVSLSPFILARPRLSLAHMALSASKSSRSRLRPAPPSAHELIAALSCQNKTTIRSRNHVRLQRRSRRRA